MLQTKTTKPPESTRALAKRPESILGGAVPRGEKTQRPPLSWYLGIVRGHKPPGHPTAHVLSSSSLDSQQETGEEARAKYRRGGGPGVCGSVDHLSLP